MFLGVITDTLGRKVPLVLGFLIAGISLVLVPSFKELYPQFLVLRILLGLGTIVAVNIPLLPDYVQKQSMGLANAYISITILLANVSGSYGLFKVSKLVNPGTIYIILGSVTIVTGLLIIIGIKDVI